MTNMIQLAICDDEPLMARELEGHIAEYMEENQITAYTVSCFSTGKALLESGGGFDLVFLDIQMEQPDGMETARLLRRQGRQSLLVFVTVLKECVFDAFQVEAFDYLVKPLDKGCFWRTMDRAMKALRQRAAKTVVIRRGASRQVVPLDGILYCEVQGRKIYLHQIDGATIDCYDRLDDFQRRVDGRFFRCHRSYLVHLGYIRRCGAGSATLEQGAKIPVSRLRERELTQALLRYMKEGAL